MRRKVGATAAPFLQRGETILAAVSVVQGSKLLIRLRAAAMLLSRFRIVAVTGANVYVLAADAMTGTRAKGVRQRHPLGSIEVWFESIERLVHWEPLAILPAGSGSTHVGQQPGTLHVGGQTFWVRARDTNDAWAVADAATQ